MLRFGHLLAVFSPETVRSWLARSIANRLTAAAVVLTMSVVAVVGMIASTISYLQIQDSVKKELESEAKLMEEYLSSSFRLLTKELSGLSANSLVSNGLLDSQGRETYLNPFLRDYRLPLGIHTSLALYDFQGGAVAGSNPGGQSSLQNAPWLERVIAEAKPIAEIYPKQQGNALRLAYPVLFPATGLVEGVLVCEIDFNELYAKSLRLNDSRFARHILGKGSEHLVWHTTTDVQQSFVDKRMVRVEAPLDALALEVEVSVARHDLLRPLYWMVAAYFLVGGILLVGVIWLTRRVVGRLTLPLIELSHATEGLAVSNMAAAKVPVSGEDEIGKLAQSFNNMIDELNLSYRMLEKQVEKRTRSLRATEAELRAQQRDYLVIFDAVRAAVAYLDAEGRVVRVNHRVSEQIGLLPDEVIGKTAQELYPGEEGKKYHADNLEAVRRREAVYGLLERRPVENGESHWFLVDRIPSFDDEGQVSGLTVFMMDIDDRVSMEEQLRQLNETLEQRVHDEVTKNREKDHLMIQQSRLAAMGEMIGNIAHQWRQPLNTLGLLLANIKDAHDYQELTGEYLDKAVLDGEILIQKMSTTIDDFRNFFRPNRTPLPFSLSKAVADAVELVSASYRNSDIGISVEIREDAQVKGFPNEYSQVLLNLMNNARDAILALENREGKKGGKVEVVVGNDGRDGYVLVRDNGGGVPEAVFGKIFDPYFTTRDKGTGIGLYMSKMIVESNMSGRIEARNTATGAEFGVFAPLCRDTEITS